MSRFIDADALIANLWEKYKEVEEKSYHYTDADEVKDAICGIVAMIDEQLTTYDVENIVQEMGKWSSEVQIVSKVDGKIRTANLINAWKAIDLVRNGGAT